MKIIRPSEKALFMAIYKKNHGENIELGNVCDDYNSIKFFTKTEHGELTIEDVNQLQEWLVALDGLLLKYSLYTQEWFDVKKEHGKVVKFLNELGCNLI